MHFVLKIHIFKTKNRKNYISGYQWIMKNYMLKNIVLLHIFDISSNFASSLVYI